MNEQDYGRSRSPFSELSFSEQQEMWRVWRAKPLQYQEIKTPVPEAAPEPVAEIISLGGGGMTKINLPEGKLERFHNPKFPKQYIERIEDVLKQKDEAFALLP